MNVVDLSDPSDQSAPNMTTSGADFVLDSVLERVRALRGTLFPVNPGAVAGGRGQAPGYRSLY